MIIDNDFSGDPDDLYQLVHHLLSTTVEIRAIIGSHLREGDPFDPGPDTAANAVAVVKDVFARMGLKDEDLILQGSNLPLTDVQTPQDSPGARAIIAEAMRDDIDSPLYYVAGGGLTDLASAYLLEPRIADKVTVVWIGGPEHDGLAYPPPGGMPVEYNLLIDVTAAQVVFGHSELALWQVPRNVYRQCLVSDAELRLRVAGEGLIGAYLYDEVRKVMDRATAQGRGPGETYALGDSPLVLLTALQSLFEADGTSSLYELRPTPALTSDGAYRAVHGSRSMRVYTWVDTRLMFEDFFLKLREFAQWQRGA
ncbi:nucleoside hydrolase [Puerhibacterium puerhi]|uniref:nucleoside hydrolase n=1 Tax=Puerhibacterium puerhi TaxID=2692623 RepID=UPI001F2E1B51|nr:nucleoside hydrolase [Puerhibacterium puerhi]